MLRAVALLALSQEMTGREVVQDVTMVLVSMCILGMNSNDISPGHVGTPGFFHVGHAVHSSLRAWRLTEQQQHIALQLHVYRVSLN